MTYCIIKIMDIEGKKPLHCIIIDNLDEVMEFDDKVSAETFRLLLETNSDSGHSYVLKKIGVRNE